MFMLLPLEIDCLADDFDDVPQLSCAGSPSEVSGLLEAEIGRGSPERFVLDEFLKRSCPSERVIRCDIDRCISANFRERAARRCYNRTSDIHGFQRRKTE